MNTLITDTLINSIWYIWDLLHEKINVKNIYGEVIFWNRKNLAWKFKNNNGPTQQVYFGIFKQNKTKKKKTKCSFSWIASYTLNVCHYLFSKLKIREPDYWSLVASLDDYSFLLCHYQLFMLFLQGHLYFSVLRKK